MQLLLIYFWRTECNYLNRLLPQHILQRHGNEKLAKKPERCKNISVVKLIEEMVSAPFSSRCLSFCQGNEAKILPLNFVSIFLWIQTGDPQSAQLHQTSFNFFSFFFSRNLSKPLTWNFASKSFIIEGNPRKLSGRYDVYLSFQNNE